MTGELVSLGAAEALEAAADLAAIWAGTTAERVRETLGRHGARDGFTFLAATADGALAGFTYGYRGGPGEWWHDRVAEGMSPAQRARWIAPGHFEYVELHVHVQHRRLGVGGRLHDELLARQAASRTAVLSTQVDNAPALALYAGRGWQVVVPRLDFGSGRIYAILGRDLP